MKQEIVRNGEVRIAVTLDGHGPLILCVHGWPELSHSWRHQLQHFAGLGYTVAAMDVRGYGASDKPTDVAAYGLTALASDVVAVIDALGGGKAILFGHDWGAPIVWTTALLHPGKVVGVAGLSVPYFPPSETAFADDARAIYADRFFYQVYFQQRDVPEAELEADPRLALRKIYFALSGAAPDGAWLRSRPADRGLLQDLPEPGDLSWLTADDLATYEAAFRQGGFRGPLNRYRAQGVDVLELAHMRGQPITPPACFIAGARDPVRDFVPGADLFADPGAACADFRGATLIPGVGHWVQQEAPRATNAALEAFLAGVSPAP